MNYFKSIMLTAFALFALAACDTDDLRDDVDNLKDRVESLEAQVSLLNDNMTAIKRLLGRWSDYHRSDEYRRYI